MKKLRARLILSEIERKMIQPPEAQHARMMMEARQQLMMHMEIGLRRGQDEPDGTPFTATVYTVTPAEAYVITMLAKKLRDEHYAFGGLTDLEKDFVKAVFGENSLNPENVDALVNQSDITSEAPPNDQDQ